MNKRKLFLFALPAVLAVAVLVFVLLPRGAKGPAVICLDPGHGGTAAGAVNGERMEKDDNLRMALRVRELLEGSGAELTVVMTREDDSARELE